jgi:LacI family transcriptional regulator
VTRDADVAVSGFDDFELSWMLPRRIRIVSYDIAELGIRAATTLLDRIAARHAAGPGSAAEPTTQLIPTALVDRVGRTRAADAPRLP